MRSFTDILLYGTFDLPLWGYILYVLIMTHITIVTVTVYYHRAQAHLALDVHPALAHFFRFWGWLTTAMNIKEWVAVHREHHARDDKEGDPHSPWVFGFRNILFFGVKYYYLALKGREGAKLLAKRGHGTPKDWIERNLYGCSRQYRRFWGVSLMLLIDLVLFGAIGALIWMIQILWIPFWAAGVINGLGHWPIFNRILGYRNTELEDHSSNIFPWGILIGGEELHNNHHANPKSARLREKWYEIDIGWMYICLFQWLGLVKVKYTNKT